MNIGFQKHPILFTNKKIKVLQLSNNRREVAPMKTIIKQIIIASVLIAIVVTLKNTVGFSTLVDNFAILFFVLLGCWFTYKNYKKRDKD
ncbi:hypothetical protein [Oceanobacillus polygoni]|uniref:Flp pilus assembly protein TadB n=1 Tax=Oceanobacillus polygoni TaxID=1235259 RepID=A0A9X1CKS7_9BACI|nr:hypothetical protein [Oceanobacillus polygoni]MBP2079708.1 Flp pilus assembly protein TadB [Oceanobacillus polygoni]